jgi:hypothetical protein
MWRNWGIFSPQKNPFVEVLGCFFGSRNGKILLEKLTLLQHVIVI